MTRTIEIHEGQTLIDIAMQYCGDSLRLFDVAELNGLEITDEIIPGNELHVPDVAPDAVRIVDIFVMRDMFPASEDDGLIAPGIVEPFEGIDYWAIEEDFVVQ